MKSIAYLAALLAFMLVQSVYSVPEDLFEKCAKSCTDDVSHQMRMNAWNLQDTDQDKCMVICTFTPLNLLKDKDSGELDMDMFTKITDNQNPKVDFTHLKIRNYNQPGFLANFIVFVNKNRGGLAKSLNHHEGFQ